MSVTWILVADSARARLFEMESTDALLTEIDCYVNPDSRAPGRDVTTDRRPTVNESVEPVRHAIEPHTTLREKSADRFAQMLGDVMERGCDEGRCDRVVLVAPPHFLGALRNGLGDRLAAHVTAEIRRDLTTLSVGEVRARLPTRLFKPTHRSSAPF